MMVLVACESSGVVRSAFRALGHEAWSCDLLPADDESPFHYHCDLREVVPLKWDIGIFHPTCTYLTCSAEWAYGDGPYHQKVKAGTLVGAARREARLEAIEFVKFIWALDIPRLCIENPKGALSTKFMKPSQIIQPHYFGDDASKETCLWIRGMPLLVPTLHVPPRIVEWPKGSGKMVKRWANQTDSGQNKLTPSDNRWKERSKTYQGIANAMASQWGRPASVDRESHLN